MYYNITQYLDITAKKNSSRIAIIDGDRQVTFSDLRKNAISLGVSISNSLNSKRRNIVAVFLAKSAESIIADIAVSYSSNAYMNLDIHHPEQRLHNIFASIKPSLIITNRKLVSQILPLAGNIPIIYIDDILSDFLSAEEERRLLTLRDKSIDTDLLCIINTSGSTGTPKGVALSHRGFINLIESEKNVGLLSEDAETLGSLAPIIFDHHIFEICLLMMSGSCLIIIPETFAAFPIRILELLEKYKVTFLFWVPTIMVNIANMDLLSTITLPSLRKIWFAGEVFPTTKLNYWRQFLPSANFVNLYGPTEISVDCSYYRVQRHLADSEPIPIGIPFPNTEIFLLDDMGHLVEHGEGEICVRGSCLAAGYYNNEGKTSSVFIQDPRNRSYPDRIYRTGDIGYYNKYGELVFKGRKDTLIKHSGYRIELGEIENVVIGSGLVSNCCVLYQQDEKQIVLFYEANDCLDEKVLRKSIGNILPRYMVPSKYIFLPEMPRNTNGKIDRHRLRSQLQ